MQNKYLTSTFAAVAVLALTGTHAFASQTDNVVVDNSEHRWMPKGPASTYWQAPNFSFPPSARPPRSDFMPPQQMPPPMRNNPYRPPVASRPPQNRPPHPGMNRFNMGQSNMMPPHMQQHPMNWQQMNHPNANMRPPMQHSNRGYPPPRGPQFGPRPGSAPDGGASAYYMPRYNPNRNFRGNNNWNNNRFWGRSGPSTWMNPSKRNWENSWDDMINTPSRMGEMPGGWTAPEVTMPNPIDMGDQMQDNVKDLPEQMRNMDVGNDVRD